MAKQVTPILTQVPTGSLLVLRSAWFSQSLDPANPKGYSIDHEGWQLWLPYVWQMFVALVDIQPEANDPESIRVNTVDGQEIDINVRTVDQVRRGAGGAISDSEVFKVAIVVKREGGLGRRQILSQVLTAALNAATSAYPAITYTSADLQARSKEDMPKALVEGKTADEIKAMIGAPLSSEQKRIVAEAASQGIDLAGVPPRYWPWICEWHVEKNEAGEIVSVRVNQTKGLVELNEEELRQLGKDVKEATSNELACYGLEFLEVNVQSINAAGALRVALQRRASSQVEVSTAARERDYIKTIIEALSGQPGAGRNMWEALIIIGNMVTDMARDVLGGIEQKSLSSVRRPEPRSED